MATSFSDFSGTAKKPPSKPDNRTRTADYEIDGKSYSFEYTGDKKPSGAEVLAKFKKSRGKGK